MTHSADYNSIPDAAWVLFEQDENTRRYYCKLDDKRTVVKTEYIASDQLLAFNKQEYEDSLSKRFGDMPKVASVPLNVLYDPANQIIEKMQSGDKDHLKWFLNSEKARPLRTFRGRV
jgi:hypothetical protein